MRSMLRAGFVARMGNKRPPKPVIIAELEGAKDYFGGKASVGLDGLSRRRPIVVLACPSEGNSGGRQRNRASGSDVLKKSGAAPEARIR